MTFFKRIQTFFFFFFFGGGGEGGMGREGGSRVSESK